MCANGHKCRLKLVWNFRKCRDILFLKNSKLLFALWKIALEKAIYELLFFSSAEMELKTIRTLIYANAKLLLQMANYTIHFILGHKQICLQKIAQV